MDTRVYTIKSLLTLSVMRDILQNATEDDLREIVHHLDHLIDVWWAAWRAHPKFAENNARLPTHPDDPVVCGVWHHDPGIEYRTESYIIAPVRDVCSPATQAWGKRTLGEFVAIRPVLPGMDVHWCRQSQISYSIRGGGQAFACRMELKRYLPQRVHPLISKVRHVNRSGKWEWVRRWWEKERGVQSWRDFHHNHNMKELAQRNKFEGLVPAWYWDRTKEELILDYLLEHEAERLAVVARYMDPLQFVRCANGKVHPEEVKDYVTRQLPLPLFCELESS